MTQAGGNRGWEESWEDVDKGERGAKRTEEEEEKKETERGKGRMMKWNGKRRA